jgi:hypothetical protein
MRTRWIASLAAASCLLSLTACSSNPGYVNIPAQRGDVASSDPNTENVRQVIEKAVQASLEQRPIQGPYELVLPERATPETYAVLTYRLGADAVIPGNIPAVPLDEEGEPIPQEGEPAAAVEPVTLAEFPALTIKAVRVRGRDGSVDLTRPDAGAAPMHEVTLRWEAGFGWFAKDVRPWRIDPNAQPEPIGPDPTRTEPEPVDRDPIKSRRY